MRYTEKEKMYTEREEYLFALSLLPTLKEKDREKHRDRETEKWTEGQKKRKIDRKREKKREARLLASDIERVFQSILFHSFICSVFALPEGYV